MNRRGRCVVALPLRSPGASLLHGTVNSGSWPGDGEVMAA